MTISTWTPLNVPIASVSNAKPGVVTTTVPHGYASGLYIRFFFNSACGMTPLIFDVINNVYLIKVLSPTTFSIGIDTTNFGTFNASGSSTQTPQIIPVAEVASTLANVERNTLTPIGG